MGKKVFALYHATLTRMVTPMFSFTVDIDSFLKVTKWLIPIQIIDSLMASFDNMKLLLDIFEVLNNDVSVKKEEQFCYFQVFDFNHRFYRYWKVNHSDVIVVSIFFPTWLVVYPQLWYWNHLPLDKVLSY